MKRGAFSNSRALVARDGAFESGRKGVADAIADHPQLLAVLLHDLDGLAGAGGGCQDRVEQATGTAAGTSARKTERVGDDAHLGIAPATTRQPGAVQAVAKARQSKVGGRECAVQVAQGPANGHTRRLGVGCVR